MKITVLAGQGDSTAILLNWLIQKGYTDLAVILETPRTRLDLLRHHTRRLGWVHTLGQVAFMVIIMPILRFESTGRQKELLSLFELKNQMPTLDQCLNVQTINDDKVVDDLHSRKTDLVLVNGTRIIRAPVLLATDAPIINTHVGITPHYRGVHGGYWSLWNNDRENFGVTLHCVDEGVDTGQILAQHKITPDPTDNFASYPLLQQAASFGGLEELLEALRKGKPLKECPHAQGEGRQWTHPTLIEYARGRLRGIR
ncbi:formyl transferase [Amylibacter sp.]|nr:formyl transferase [Amylibacter sp.]